MKQLTARSVKILLTSNGIDYKPLTIVETPHQFLGHDGEWHPNTEVTISGGTKAQRRAAHQVLFWDAGLCVAPYPDRDIYSYPRMGADHE